MDAPSDEPTRPTRRRGAQARTRRGDGAPKLIRKTFQLPADAIERLLIESHRATIATGRRVTESEIVARCINECLRRYVVSDRGGGAGQGPADRTPSGEES